VGITDNITELMRNQQAPPGVAAPQQSSWIQDLISQRYQPKTERLKRTPVGFDFKRDPFDTSSYYNDLKSFSDISRGATNVNNQVVANRQAMEQQKAFEASQRALGGVNPNFTGAGYSVGSALAGASRKYNLKGISKSASNAANYFGSKYGIKTIGGRGPGSVPGSDHPKGRALDYMINNIKNGKAVGTALANDVIKNYKAWNVKYVIWNRYIWQPGRGWKKYNGPSPHTDHVHVSFNS
jgi:hypothetical protein